MSTELNEGDILLDTLNGHQEEVDRAGDIFESIPGAMRALAQLTIVRGSYTPMEHSYSVALFGIRLAMIGEAREKLDKLWVTPQEEEKDGNN